MNAEMNNTSAQQNSVESSELSQKLGICYFSQYMGVTYNNKNSLAQNQVIMDRIASCEESEITKDGDHTTFPVDVKDFAHFMHLVYCTVPEGRMVQVDFDGISPFDAADENGVMQKFNAQMVTITEVDAF